MEGGAGLTAEAESPAVAFGESQGRMHWEEIEGGGAFIWRRLSVEAKGWWSERVACEGFDRLESGEGYSEYVGA